MGNKTNLRKCLIIVAALLFGTNGHAKADFIFGMPTNLGPAVNSSALDAGPSISADGLTLIFFSNRSGGYGGYDLWVTKRTSISDPWGKAVNLGAIINSSAHESHASISTDGLSLYFGEGTYFSVSPRPGGLGQSDIWVASRATIFEHWGTPGNLGPTVNSSANEGGPSLSGDGLILIFDSDRPGGSGRHDLWMTTRPTVSDPWGQPVNLGPTVNSSALDAVPGISADGLVLFFMSNRTGGARGDYCIWVTTRPSVSDTFGTPVILGTPVNSSAIEATQCISADGSTLFFMSERSGGIGGFDMWQVPIIPIVDLNGDGIVDSADMCIMVDHWFTDDPLCDIGPTPFGDGIVDVQDLIVLAEHFFEEIPPIE